MSDDLFTRAASTDKDFHVVQGREPHAALRRREIRRRSRVGSGALLPEASEGLTSSFAGGTRPSARLRLP
jgi:hypothetical protein